MSTPVTPEEFKSCMTRFASGVTVVTTRDEQGTPWGLTVSAFSSISLDPPLCMVAIDHHAGSFPVFKAARALAVNILSDRQESLSNRFASRQPDKFEGLPWNEGSTFGCPILPECLANCEAEIVQRVETGDHDIFVARLCSVTVADGKPLLYYGGAYGDLTSRPKSW